jgi:hypothetical protein
LHPKNIPNSKPKTDITKETKPIINIGEIMLLTVLIPIKAKDTPTARASRLVAMANVKTTFKQAGLKSLLHSSSLNDSHIILPPRKA